jgi:hypothetical protein
MGKCDIRNLFHATLLLSLLSSCLLLASRLRFVGLALNALFLLLVLNGLDGGRSIAGFGNFTCFLGLGVSSLYVRVRRRDTVLLSRLVGIDKAFVDLVALSIDDACTCLVAGLEADLAGEGLDFVVVQDATVLVTVLNALLLGDNRKVRWDNRSSLRRR